MIAIPWREMALVYLGGVLVLVVMAWMVAEILIAFLITHSIREREGRPMFKKLFQGKLGSILKGAGIAAGGALVTYGGALIASGTIAGLGPYGPLIAAGASVLINVARKALEKAEPIPAPAVKSQWPRGSN